MRNGFRIVIAVCIGFGLITGSVYESGVHGSAPSAPHEWSPKPPGDVLWIAHRGASGYAPENTMAAFEKAWDMGADMIELDVQLSSDHQVVVIHDTKVNRTSGGKGLVQNLTLKKLKELDAGSWYDPQFSGQRIPTLDEVLKRFGGKIPLLIEMKSPSINPGIERKTAELLRHYGLDKSNDNRKEVIIQSFHIASLRRFHKMIPEVPLAALVSDPLELTEGRIRAFAKFAEYVNLSIAVVTVENVRRIQNAGMKVFVWNVHQLLEVPPLLQAGVHGIITDYPDLVPTHMYSLKVYDPSISSWDPCG